MFYTLLYKFFYKSDFKKAKRYIAYLMAVGQKPITIKLKKKWIHVSLSGIYEKKSRNYEKRYRQNNADEYKDDNDIFIYRRGKTLICLPLLWIIFLSVLIHAAHRRNQRGGRGAYRHFLHTYAVCSIVILTWRFSKEKKILLFFKGINQKKFSLKILWNIHPPPPTPGFLSFSKSLNNNIHLVRYFRF